MKEKNIAIIFEKENINTLEASGELLLTIMASLAQQESASLSQNVKLGLQFRYQEGKVQVNHEHFLGYTKNEDGNLIVVEEEVKIVRRIFREYLEGASFRNIAEGLERDKIKTGGKKYKWHLSTVQGILRNEKYIGDALLQKTITTDFIEKTRIKNDGSVPQYYVNPNKTDKLRQAMEKRNEDLSEHILVAKLQEILRSNYSGTIDLKNVDYQRIFGQKEKNYGDYDIVFYVADKKELFLIESKYFSDSLNSSGLVNDYNKMFGKGGYYTHCRERYDLIMKEPEKIKSFINETDDISVHMLFISSKPIEMEFQDADGIVTFLSLGIFEKYLKGNLISEDGMSVVRPVHVI